jgi:hypothetical protein
MPFKSVRSTVHSSALLLLLFAFSSCAAATSSSPRDAVPAPPSTSLPETIPDATTAALPLPAAWAPAVPHRITTVSWTLPDSIVVSEERGSSCSARSLSASGVAQWEHDLPFCPDRAAVVAGGMVLFAAGDRSLLLARDGSPRQFPGQIVAAASESLVLSRSHGLLEVAGTDIHLPDRGVASSAIAERQGHATVVLDLQDGRGAWSLVGEPEHRVLTPPFPAIDSFDLSSDGREVVFSARRESGGFDVGLVSTDGGGVHWLPSDPADEVAVRWAPVGYRAGYLIRRGDGDLFRSIHIPTSVQLVIDFSLSSAVSWDWSPDAARIAIITSSPDRADHVDLVSGDGVVRRPLVEPRRRAELHVETLGGFPDTILTRPALMKYNETVPLVVWTGEASPLRWDEARGHLAGLARVASVVTPRAAADLDADFWRRLKSLGWIDSSRIYVVGAGLRSSGLPAGATLITAVTGEASPPGYRQIGAGGAVTVLLTAGSSAVVKSFAASYIANRLKGNAPPQ